jgi:hypothetical protein
MEANKLRADLDAGRIVEQAVWQAEQAYLSAMHRLPRQLQEILRSMTGEDTDRSPTTSPQQDTVL